MDIPTRSSTQKHLNYNLLWDRYVHTANFTKSLILYTEYMKLQKTSLTL